MAALKGAIARRYAEAIFDTARGRNAIDRWRDDVAYLAELFTNRRLAAVLSDPRVLFATKKAIVSDLAASRVQSDALGLALLLVDDGHIDLMARVKTEFERIYDDDLSRAHATVTTAVPIDEAERAEIEALLRRMTGKRQITITSQIDPAILGGVIARVGDMLIDGSVRHRLDVLRERIATGVDAPTRGA